VDDRAADDARSTARSPFEPRHRRARVQRDVLAAVAAGGALGAPARYGFIRLMATRAGTFPWATLIVNVSGCAALGFLLVLVLDRFPPTRYVRPFVATGFLGAYTTFSTFTVETDLLVKGGRAGIALLYVVVSLVAGIAATFAGIGAARRLPVRPRR
jgi:fluoride exporter